MASDITVRRNSTFQVKFSDDERADLEAFVADHNARIPLGRVTMTDVVRTAVREYMRRSRAIATVPQDSPEAIPA